MTTVNLNVTHEGKCHEYFIDLGHPAARLMIRAWNRLFPGTPQLAKLAYPDDQIVIERLGTMSDPATLTRCKDGAIDLRCPTRHIYQYDPLIPLSSESLAEFRATEEEKDRLFSLCARRIYDAGDMLLPENLKDATLDELLARRDALMLAAEESFALRAFLGEAFGENILAAVSTIEDELAAAYGARKGVR